MDLIDDIIQGEIIFPRRFAAVERREYGILYHAAEIPDSHDGNHACILQPQDLGAAVERAGPVARVDAVLTHKPCRGRGYSRALIHELVRYHSRVLGSTLCLYTDNPTAARIYEEDGFEKLAVPLEGWSAWQD